jgi:hypothetical protein
MSHRSKWGKIFEINLILDIYLTDMNSENKVVGK